MSKLTKQIIKDYSQTFTDLAKYDSKDMQIIKQPTSVTVTFNPQSYWLRKCDDQFLGEYKLTHRIDMSYKGKSDQEGADVLYLSEKEAKEFRDAGFDELL